MLDKDHSSDEPDSSFSIDWSSIPSDKISAVLALSKEWQSSQTNADNPISRVNDLNLYRYVGNQPLSKTDPTGLATKIPGTDFYIGRIHCWLERKGDYDWKKKKPSGMIYLVCEWDCPKKKKDDK
jgi:hypothetical protein